MRALQLKPKPKPCERGWGSQPPTLRLGKHATTLRRVDIAGWHHAKDIRSLFACVSHIQHLSVERV